MKKQFNVVMLRIIFYFCGYANVCIDMNSEKNT